MSSNQLNAEKEISAEVKIAYFILVHRMPEQFFRLFNAIYNKDNYYLIHLDKKAENEHVESITQFLSPIENAHILDSENVVWGGYSMVHAELKGMEYLLNHAIDWDFFINLSGQDYPLKSQDIIRTFLKNNPGNNFIKIANQAISRPETMNRIDHFYEESDNSIHQSVKEREFMKGMTPYIGGQWMILTRACCDFICNSGESEVFIEYYKNTLIADESFFQTVLMNSSFDGTLINDDLRAIIWVPDGEIKLRPKTFTKKDFNFLIQGSNLFARKFDDHIDNQIINALNLRLNLPIQIELIDFKTTERIRA